MFNRLVSERIKKVNVLNEKVLLSLYKIGKQFYISPQKKRVTNKQKNKHKSIQKVVKWTRHHQNYGQKNPVEVRSEEDYTVDTKVLL